MADLFSDFKGQIEENFNEYVSRVEVLDKTLKLNDKKRSRKRNVKGAVLVGQSFDKYSHISFSSIDEALQYIIKIYNYLIKINNNKFILHPSIERLEIKVCDGESYRYLILELDNVNVENKIFLFMTQLNYVHKYTFSFSLVIDDRKVLLYLINDLLILNSQK